MSRLKWLSWPLTGQVSGWTVALLLIGCSVVKVQGQANPANFITIREKAGVTTSNYPIQIGRPFVQGEILTFPQAVVGGLPVITQADVKTRWPDGSVKHAVLTFYLPRLNANSTVTVTFINQLAVNNAKHLSQREMLHRNYNFDARMELTNGSTVTASARDMLEAGKFEYWNRGVVTTSIILADHSLNRIYDIGFDAHRSFRPIFHATFWPSLRKVKVRYIGEVANTIALQDQNYSLVLKLKNTQPQTVYTKAGINHISASRWTKEFWIGGAPPLSEINHNLAYLKQTKALPNYDTTKVVSEAALVRAYTDSIDGWSVVSKDLFDPGNLTKLMPTAGGRDEIGPYPTWLVRWLYTGDWRVQQQTFGNAELAAAFPVHFREGLSGRLFDRNGPPAVGKVLSITARPTVFLHSGNSYINYLYTDPVDKIVPVGTMTDGGWLPDVAHQPDYFSPVYTLTGDYFYLEELYFWAAWSAASTNWTDQYFWGRGPTGDTGGIYDEVRGDAWTLRNRAQTAYFAPDGTPEKTYFTRLTNDAIAVWEGTLSLTGTQFQGSAPWNWGNTVAVRKYGTHGTPAVPPLCFWEEGSTVPAWSWDVDPAMATNRTPPWQHFYLVYAIGRTKELGFPAGKLLTWIAPLMVGQLTNPGYDPRLIAAYQMPTVKLADNLYFATWPEERSGFLNSYNPQIEFDNNLYDPNHGYVYIALPATAMIAGEPGSTSAWQYLQQNVLGSPLLNDNPKWVIVPR